MIICIHHNMSTSHAIFLAATSLGLGLFPHTRGLFSKAPIHPQPSSLRIPQASNSMICGVDSSHSARAAALILSHCAQLGKWEKFLSRKTKRKVLEMRCRDSPARSESRERKVGAAYPSRLPSPLLPASKALGLPHPMSHLKPMPSIHQAWVTDPHPPGPPAAPFLQEGLTSADFCTSCFSISTLYEPAQLVILYLFPFRSICPSDESAHSQGKGPIICSFGVLQSINSSKWHRWETLDKNHLNDFCSVNSSKSLTVLGLW